MTIISMRPKECFPDLLPSKDREFALINRREFLISLSEWRHKYVLLEHLISLTVSTLISLKLQILHYSLS